MRVSRSFAVLGLVGLIAAPAWAKGAGWREVGRTSIPLYYYQGVTHDPAGNRYFTGVDFGLYRTDPALQETGRNDDVIPPEVHLTENYNHIGDLSYYGGRLFLPLECYYPPAGNTCLTGSVGVADPETLEFLYYVKLDPSEIEKVMWNEISPDGSLLWTQQGNDLLAYRVSDIGPQNAGPGAAPIHSVKKLVGAVPPSGITGATFIGDRLFVSGGTDDGGEIYSIVLTTGTYKSETAIDFVGESEGIDDDFDLKKAADKLPGSLHYMVQPYNEEGIPTNGITNGVLYHFERSNGR
ncbi:MAG: hypothetical protein QOH90_972 [Actinomycetota bacterium]|nr:hypothetical protein [Actinomycetota bacterium]